MTAVGRTGFLGLGSNQGDRRARLQAAVDGLPGAGVQVLGASSVYETEPVGAVPDQRPFLNAALRIATAHEPAALLAACKGLERRLGRPPAEVRHGPRPIDIDLLLLGDLELRADRLRLPHPEIARRRFVLVPLLELDPELSAPGVGALSDALAGLGPEGWVRRAGPPLALATGPRPASTP